MKSLILQCILIIWLTAAHAQQKNDLVIGSVVDFHSQILNEQRKIWVHVPGSYGAGTRAKRKFPVVYLLDAEKNFTGVVGMIDLLSSMNGNNIFPEMIIVGIPNTDRIRDLTPTHVVDGLWIDSSMARRSGGGEVFLAFIEKELIPFIDSNYRTSPYRMLIGHSLGGLMVINAFVHHNTLFSSYVAIDPSMWWDKQRLLHETAQVLKTTSYKRKSLVLVMAHSQAPGMDTSMVQSDTTDGTLHPRGILELSRYIMDNGKNGLQAGFKYYDEESHGSVPLISTYDALHFIFNDYQLHMQDKYLNDSTFQLASFLKDHYEKISSEYDMTSEDGRALLPPEDLVNNLGFYALGKKQFHKAEDMFKLNVTNYPAGFAAYNYLGDLYSAKGEKAKAIVSYKKALSLKENAETKKKLEKLEGNQAHY